MLVKSWFLLKIFQLANSYHIYFDIILQAGSQGQDIKCSFEVIESLIDAFWFHYTLYIACNPVFDNIDSEWITELVILLCEINNEI